MILFFVCPLKTRESGLFFVCGLGERIGQIRPIGEDEPFSFFLLTSNSMEYNHFEYGRELAGQLRPIVESADERKYYTCSESDGLYDLTSRLSNAKGCVMVAIDGCNSDFEMNRGDGLFEIPQYFFLFLQPAKTDSPQDILAKQMGCKRICRQVQARMLQDMSGPTGNGPLKCLVPNSMTIRGVGPVGDNLYGAILGFNLKLNVEWELDDEYWTIDS